MLPAIPFALIQVVLAVAIFSGEARSTDFGQRQVDQLLEDRPELFPIIENNLAIKNWILDRFNGGEMNLRVYWHAEEPWSGRPAEHSIPIRGYPALIRITSKNDLTAEDKCIALIFEFFNLENESNFKKLWEAENITSQEFAKKALMLEVGAVFRMQPLLQRTEFSSVLGKSIYYKSYSQLRKDITFSELIKHPAYKLHFDYWESEYKRIRQHQ
jgi:hypothetical protein